MDFVNDENNIKGQTTLEGLRRLRLPGVKVDGGIFGTVRRISIWMIRDDCMTTNYSYPKECYYANPLDRFSAKEREERKMPCRRI